MKNPDLIKKPTVAIGIPAYNEERNIKKLISSLAEQNLGDLRLDKIMVYSDASTDRTDEIIKHSRNDKVYLFENEIRKGKSAGQNAMANLAEADILILLDADILIDSNFFIQNISQPLLDNPDVGLVGARIIPAGVNNFVQSVLASSHEFKNKLALQINQGDNPYLCYGAARAFSKRFYKNITWPNDSPEDAYSYLRCQQLGLKFRHSGQARILFRLPANLTDHAKQSRRFYAGNKMLEKYFDKEVVKKSFQIPKHIFFRNLVKYFLLHPVEAGSYSIMMIYIRFFKNFNVNIAMWEISKSTKQ